MNNIIIINTACPISFPSNIVRKKVTDTDSAKIHACYCSGKFNKVVFFVNRDHYLQNVPALIFILDFVCLLACLLELPRTAQICIHTLNVIYNIHQLATH